MYGLLSRNGFKRMVLFFCVPWVLLGCGDLDTGGSDKSGSLWNVIEVDPIYFDESTNQIDVVQDNCAAPDEDPDPGAFSDAYAEIFMTNRPLPNAEEQTASWIFLTGYEIHFTPLSQLTPPPPTFNTGPISESFGIEPCEPGSSCQAESFRAEFVPLELKRVLYQYLVDNPTAYQLQYNVHYIFHGVNDFSYPVSAEGSSFFYALDYDNCGG
jgi:hypothetical protein